MEALFALLACAGLGVVTGWLTRRGYIASEAAIMAFVLLAFAIASVICAWGNGVAITSGSAGRMYLTGEESLATAFILLRAATTLLVILAIIALLPGHARLAARIRDSRTARGASRLALSERTVSWMLLVAFAALIIGVGANFQDLIVRSAYQFESKGSITTVLSNLTLPAGILAAIATFLTKRPLTRFLGSGVFVLGLLVEMSKASRSLAVLCVAAGVIYFLISSRSLLQRTLGLMVGVIAASISLILVLQLRAANDDGEYGVIAFSKTIFSGQISFAPDRWASMINNLLASLPITFISADRGVPEGFLVTSLTPLPGTSTDWYDLSPLLSISRGVPMNAVGQIASLPFWEGLLAWGVVAILLSLPAVFRHGFPERLALVAEWGSWAIVGTATVQMLQYSLRTATRYMWLAVGLTFVLWIVVKISQNLANSRGSTERRKPLAAMPHQGLSSAPARRLP